MLLVASAEVTVTSSGADGPAAIMPAAAPSWRAWQSSQSCRPVTVRCDGGADRFPH